MLLNAEGVRKALRALGEDLVERGIEGAQINIVGGVAVLFQTYDRPSTIDIDAFLAPETEILESAARVAVKLNLPTDWLNSAATQFLPSAYDGRGAQWQECPVSDLPFGLYFGTVEMLLAMKTLSFIKRPTRDSVDLLNLAVQACCTTLDLVLENFEGFYPDYDVPDVVREKISQLLLSTHKNQVRGPLPF